ncbi:MAG: diacylglycerol kinase family protein [Planctomycetia bacterium]|nr:diacylglycerol kinase family protein [Planctomycetia bacterium]
MTQNNLKESQSFELRPKFIRQKRTWRAKFHDSFLGIRQSVRRQSSYRVHFFFAILTILAAWGLRFDLIRWALLILVVFIVLAAEMFNTALENMAREITDEESEYIAHSLNIASGAVLVVSLAAVLVGLILFGDAILKFF